MSTMGKEVITIPAAMNYHYHKYGLHYDNFQYNLGMVGLLVPTIGINRIIYQNILHRLFHLTFYYNNNLNNEI